MNKKFLAMVMCFLIIAAPISVRAENNNTNLNSQSISDSKKNKKKDDKCIETKPTKKQIEQERKEKLLRKIKRTGFGVKVVRMSTYIGVALGTSVGIVPGVLFGPKVNKWINKERIKNLHPKCDERDCEIWTSISMKGALSGAVATGVSGLAFGAYIGGKIGNAILKGLVNMGIYDMIDAN